MKFEDLDLLAFGNTSTLAGVVYTGEPNVLLWLPGEAAREVEQIVDMTDEDWKAFIQQSDDVNVLVGTAKTVMRKSLRAIDQNITWQVYQMDNFKCRYCGRTGIPLSVDHVDLWENGGATIKENLLTACKRCNKLRGNMEYKDWLNSGQYVELSKGVTDNTKELNRQVLQTLPHLVTLRVKVIKAR